MEPGMSAFLHGPAARAYPLDEIHLTAVKSMTA
jgi:hypothetical protein